MAKFNNSKKAVQMREQLKTYNDDRIAEIVDNIDIFNIYKHDLSYCSGYIQQAYQDLLIEQDLGLMILYLEKIEEYLNICDTKVFTVEYMIEMAREQLETRIKNFFGDGSMKNIIRAYLPYCHSDNEMKIFISQIQANTMDKMYYMSNQKITEEIEAIVDSYEELYEQYEFLKQSIRTMFDLDALRLELEKLTEAEIKVAELNRKIFDFRSLEKLANESGYQLDRVSGSHYIYTNGQHSIPIPKHAQIGKGLSFKIQKQIKGDKR